MQITHSLSECEQKMVLFKAWITEISANPSLITSAVEEGLHQLGYKSVKPQQLAAIESLLKEEDMFMSVPTGFGSLSSTKYSCSARKAYSVLVKTHGRSSHSNCGVTSNFTYAQPSVQACCQRSESNVYFWGKVG